MHVSLNLVTSVSYLFCINKYSGVQLPALCSNSDQIFQSIDKCHGNAFLIILSYDVETNRLRQPKWVTFSYSTLWWLSAISCAAWSRKHIWTELILRQVFLMTVQCEPVTYLFTEPMQH